MMDPEELLLKVPWAVPPPFAQVFAFSCGPREAKSTLGGHCWQAIFQRKQWRES